MCQKYRIWKSNAPAIVQFMKQLPKLSELSSNKWMSNEDID